MKTAMLSMLLGLFAVSAYAITPEREAELKEAYWVCDRMSMEDMLSAGDAAICSEIYEELLKEVFNGDFQKFMEWWRANKPK